MPSSENPDPVAPVEIPLFLRKRDVPQEPAPEASEGDDEDDFAETRDLVLDTELPGAQDTLDSAPLPSDRVLFPGDCGELKGETRRALVALLAGPSVDGDGPGFDEVVGPDVVEPLRPEPDAGAVGEPQAQHVPIKDIADGDRVVGERQQGVLACGVGPQESPASAPRTA